MKNLQFAAGEASIVSALRCYTRDCEKVCALKNLLFQQARGRTSAAVDLCSAS
ncbi:MAG: hypothetical protein SO314_00055 [Alphaproteobacteria bacterium]|nr:hypothetical protein [Alphaproteobacteria bacterium]